jgi:anti-anti-sigma factor
MSEPKAPFALRAEHRGGVARIHARGELDLETVPLLERVLEAVDEFEPVRVVLDFRDLTFVDSTGVHAIMRAHTRFADSGRILVVMSGTESVRKVFELTRTEHLLEIANADDRAVGPLDDERGWVPITIPETEPPG